MANITLRASPFFTGAGLQLQPGERTVFKRNGVAEKTSVYMSFGYPSSLPIPLYTPYPDQSTGGFVCDEVSTESLAGGFYRTIVKWVSLYNGPTSYQTFETKVIQVPIDQSANFVDIAGTPEAPLNGAIFESSGSFLGFGPGDYQGVVSAFVQQNLYVVRGSDVTPPAVRQDIFAESMTSTLRGQIWEYEIVYNLDINVSNGIPTGGAV
jgi:hypothetical protein